MLWQLWHSSLRLFIASVPSGFSMIWSTWASRPEARIPHIWHLPSSLEMTASLVRRHAAEQYPRSAAVGRGAFGLGRKAGILLGMDLVPPCLPPIAATTGKKFDSAGVRIEPLDSRLNLVGFLAVFAKRGENDLRHRLISQRHGAA